MAHMPGSVGIAEHMTKQDDMQSEKAQQLQTTLEENERLQSRVLELETVLQRVTQAGDQHATQEQEVHEAMQQQIDQLIQSNNRLTSEKDQIESTVAQLQSDLLALVNCLSSGKLDDVGQEIVKRIRPDSAISLGEIRFGAESDTGAGLKDEYDEVLPPIVDLVAGPRSPSRPLKPRSHRRRLRGPNSLHEGDDEHNRLVASLHRLEDELFASEQRVKELLSEREIANAKPRSDVEVQTVQVEEAEDVEKDDMQRNIYILQGALAAAEQNVEKLACVVERLEKVNINLVNENDALKEQHQAHEAIIGLHAKEVDRTKQMVDWGSESDEAEQYSGSGTHSPSENASVLGPDDFPVHVSNVNRQHIGSDVHSEVDHSKRQEDKQDGHSGIPWNDPARSQLIVDLELANRARVEAAKEVARVNKEAERVRQQYNERVIKLERDLEAANRDVSKLGAELVEKDQAREKLKEEHDRKIKALDAQILKLKAKQKDYNRLAKEKDALERRCEEVKPEVERLKVIANDLKKKLKDDGDRHNEVEKRLTKDLARVEKQRDEEIRRCRSLEDEVELLRRRVASGRTRPGGTNSAKRRISGRGVGDDFDLDVVAPEAKNANSDGRQEKESRPATTDATHVDATSAKYRSVIDSLRDQINEGQGILSGLDRDSVMYSKVLEKVELLTLRLQEAKEQAREESETQAQPDDTNEVRWNSLEKRAASYGDTVVASVQQLRASPIATSVKMHVVQAITAIMDQYDAVSLRRPPHSASQASQTDIVLHMDSNIPPECECARYQTMIKELKEKLKMVVGVNHRLAGALERERKRGVDAR
ncbi:hypothetical protein BC832DRAFT_487530 [Gaertneriomyces semiglobifer]|nr:hypothetical protein BC832DRAFT_487530 [Gaertneriomyces semiglobifer]